MDDFDKATVRGTARLLQYRADVLQELLRDISLHELGTVSQIKGLIHSRIEKCREIVNEHKD